MDVYCCECGRPIEPGQTPVRWGDDRLCPACHQDLLARGCMAPASGIGRRKRALRRRRLGVLACLAAAIAVPVCVAVAVREPGQTPLQAAGVALAIAAAGLAAAGLVGLLWRSGPIGQLLVGLWLFDEVRGRHRD